MEETMMDKKTQKIGVICSIVQIILSIICLIYNAINQENIIIWVLFLCSGILLLSSNISRNNKKEDEWGSATSNLYGLFDDFCSSLNYTHNCCKCLAVSCGNISANVRYLNSTKQFELDAVALFLSGYPYLLTLSLLS